MIHGNDNLQLQGNNNDIKVEHNHVSSLKVSPKDIKVEASVNVGWIPYLMILLCMIIFYFTAMALLDWFPHVNANILLLLAAIPCLFAIPIFFRVADKIIFKFKTLHAIYTDGVLTLNGKDYKFYEDIWDIKYRKSLFGLSGILTFYILDPKRKVPFKESISFLHDAKAKYVYDSFFSEERIDNHNKTLQKQLNTQMAQE